MHHRIVKLPEALEHLHNGECLYYSNGKAYYKLKDNKLHYCYPDNDVSLQRVSWNLFLGRVEVGDISIKEELPGFDMYEAIRRMMEGKKVASDGCRNSYGTLATFLVIEDERFTTKRVGGSTVEDCTFPRVLYNYGLCYEVEVINGKIERV